MSDITIHIHWHTVWIVLASVGTFAAGFIIADVVIAALTEKKRGMKP